MPIGKSGAATQNALVDEVTRPQQRIEDDASGIDAVDEGIRPHHVGFFGAYDVDDTESGICMRRMIREALRERNAHVNRS